VRVAYGLFVSDGVRADDGFPVVEGDIVVTISTEGKADLLLPGCVAVKVGEEIAYVSLFVVFLLATAE
jgi:hypothetical protein